MGAYEGLSPMNISVPNIDDMNSPRIGNTRSSDRNLIRESADITQLVTETFAQNEDFAFESNENSVHPGNM